jgi:hypothetical protein
MWLRRRKVVNLFGFVILFGFLGALLGCVGNSGAATAVPPNNTSTLIVFYTDN